MAPSVFHRQTTELFTIFSAASPSAAIVLYLAQSPTALEIATRLSFGTRKKRASLLQDIIVCSLKRAWHALASVLFVTAAKPLQLQLRLASTSAAAAVVCFHSAATAVRELLM